MKQALNLRRFMPDDDLLAVARARPAATPKHDGTAADVVIYTIPTSICSQRLRMTLLEKGVPYTDRTVAAARGENLTPEYIALNPRALVPTMTFAGRSIFDSATMIRFINNYFAGPELAPPGQAAFDEMNRWIDRADDFPLRGFVYRAHLSRGLPDYWKPAMYENIIEARRRYPEHAELYDLKLADWQDLQGWMANPGDAAEGEAIANHLADDCEAALARGRYLVGDDLTLADATMSLLLMRLQYGCGVQLLGQRLRPRTADYIGRIKLRPSYDNAVLKPFRDNGIVQVDGESWLVGAD